MELWQIFIIVFIVAMILSTIGHGGASIYTPLFLWLSFPLTIAIPMALLLNVVTSGSASYNYLKQRAINKSIALPMIFTSITGAIIGSYISHQVKPRFLVLLLATILLLVGLQMLIVRDMDLNIKKGRYIRRSIGGGLGFIIGIIDSMVGIGGGTFMVPVLLVLGLEIKNAAPTATFIITFTALAGFLGHLRFGTPSFNLETLLFTGIAAFSGAYVGSKLIFKHLHPRFIIYAFAIIILFISAKLFYDNL